MARTLDPVLHQERRGMILDATARLIATRGFEAMTIADVLAATGISKGALYHYFTGKDELLVALVERRLTAWAAAIESAPAGVESPEERLIALVRTLVAAKSEDLTVLLGALPRLQAESNAAAFMHLRTAASLRFGPQLAQVIEDGVTTGAFRVTSAPSAAKVVLALLQDLSATVSRGLLELSRSHEAETSANAETSPAAGTSPDARTSPDAGTQRARSARTAPDQAQTESERVEARLRADVAAFSAAIPAVLDASIDPEQIVHPDDLDVWITSTKEPR